jgi:crotonobetainyl-CoA:carnitine CoA-transferase CaiB-like acyl-CoA transferase
MCPYRAFEAADGPILLGVANDGLWRRFCTLAGLEAIVDDAKFRTNADRVTHRAETEDLVQQAIAQRPVAFWNGELAKIGVPCAPINTLKQVLEHPHTEASGLIVKYDHPHGGPIQSVGLPFVLGDEPREAGAPPPLLGEHTQVILQEMGLSARQIEELRLAKAIA